MKYYNQNQNLILSKASVEWFVRSTLWFFGIPRLKTRPREGKLILIEEALFIRLDQS